MSGIERFVSENDFIDNTSNQMDMAPLTLEHLYKTGVEHTDELRLEFFFYTDEERKAELLARDLRRLDYSVEYGVSTAGDRTWLITGWSTKLRMDEKTLLRWTRDMCETGFRHDCQFDGWGTSPDQEEE